jgi:hypothetical protein
MCAPSGDELLRSQPELAAQDMVAAAGAETASPLAKGL